MLVQKSFYFVRHGQTDHNLNNLCAGGSTNSSLNKVGEQQALALKEKLKNINIDHVVTSPQIRAHKTAELSGKGNIILEEGLKEWELGDLEEAPVKDFIAHTKSLDHFTPLPNGESKKELLNRILKAINYALENYEGNILFVSHGMVYCTLLELLKEPMHFIDNCCLVHFKVVKNGWQLGIID